VLLDGTSLLFIHRDLGERERERKRGGQHHTTYSVQLKKLNKEEEVRGEGGILTHHNTTNGERSSLKKGRGGA
jgi:hypothetical protein